MKNLLIETLLIIKVSLFWLCALPLAALVLPVLAGWEQFNVLLQGDRDSAHAVNWRPASAAR